MERLRIDELNSVIQQGETEYVEFKYGTLVLDVIAKCMAAFANARVVELLLAIAKGGNKSLEVLLVTRE